MLIKLTYNKKRLIKKYCEERFGMPPNLLQNFKLYEGSKNKIYLIQKITEIRINPESAGLCIFRLDKTPKPTTNFLQLFGSKIKRNVLDINKANLIEYCEGNNLEIDIKKNNIEPGFIAIRYKMSVIGCAHWNKNIIKNQLPKSRRCRINYC